MTDAIQDTVLLVCGCPEMAEDLLGRLYRHGIGVVGPAPTAGVAMMLAAQTIPTVAVVAGPPQGRRDAAAFGRDLMSTFGLRTWVLEGVDEEDTASAGWAIEAASHGRLRRALEGEQALS